MTETINQPLPKSYLEIAEATQLAGFPMASDVLACSLLRTLAAAKPAGQFLELGTGTALSTAWILDGMDAHSSLVSIDNEPTVLDIATRFLGHDARLGLINTDAGEWIKQNQLLKFDYIFADTWHGKYLLIEETLSMLNKGGFYIIDDMLPQSNWPDGHQEKAIKLVKELEAREDLILTKQTWATGVIIAVKK